jgi:hypothetical protein
MKRLITLAMTMGCMLQLQLVSAQSAEVQQLVLNVEKLVQFKQILSDMKKGYTIVSNGYGAIKDISEGNFSLHRTFLDGLMAVNPELRKYRKVADIITYQARILSEYKEAFNRFRNGGHFSSQEITYLGKVYGNLFDRSLENLDELAMVLTANELRMSDDERLQAIDRIYDDMQQKLSFLRRFNKKTASLDQSRKQQQTDNANLKKIQGLQ